MYSKNVSIMSPFVKGEVRMDRGILKILHPKGHPLL